MVREPISRNREAGASAFFVAVILIFVMVAALAAHLLSTRRGDVDRSSKIASQFARVDAAIIQFVAVNGRLPCPADPGDSTATNLGKAAPDRATTPADRCAVASAAEPNGTIPWATLGLSQADSLDSWGAMISYRPFVSDPARATTNAQGASLVNCDTIEPSPADIDLDGSCRTTNDTSPTQFLGLRGFRVNDFGNAVDGVAYILVSHGPTGFGAYLPAGSHRPPPANPLELANFSLNGPFTAQAASTKEIAPGSAGHFDDLVYYRKVEDVIHAAGLDARDWPEIVGTTPLNAATLGTALGIRGNATYGDLGQSSVMVNSVTVGTSGPNIGLGQVNAGAGGASVDGIGLASGGSIALTSNASGGTNGYIRFALPRDATSFAISLAGFGISATGYADGVRLQFLDASSIPVATVTKYGCRADPTLATFAVDVPAFRYVSVEAQPAKDALANTADSSFLISDATACADSAAICKTRLAGASSDCP